MKTNFSSQVSAPFLSKDAQNTVVQQDETEKSNRQFPVFTKILQGPLVNVAFSIINTFRTMDQELCQLDTQRCVGFSRSVANESYDALITRLREEELFFRQTMELAKTEDSATIYERNYIFHSMRRRLVLFLLQSVSNASASNKLGWDRQLDNSSRCGDEIRLREEELLWEQVNILSNTQFGCTEQDRRHIRAMMRERVLNAMSKQGCTMSTYSDEVIPSTQATNL